MPGKLDCFVCDLRCQFSGRTDDECTDVGLRVLVDGARNQRLAVVHRVLLNLLRVCLERVEPSFDSRYQKCQCFTSASACLDHEITGSRVLLVRIVGEHKVGEEREDGSLD